MQKQMTYNLEVRDVVDQGQFNQNLHFSALTAPDEEQAVKMMGVLVQLGVDLNQKDNLKQSPLFYAARDGKCKIIQFLIEQGMPPNDTDIYGQNAIYYAINLGNLEATKLLKSYGSNHDMVDENG